MIEGGVTDVQTAKNVAKKLFQNYTNGSSLEKGVFEKMMIDTYKIMNKQFRPTVQDVNLYGNVLDFNGDGKVTLEDF